MTIETTKRPYELLVRWDAEGLRGAHVRWVYTTTEDGEVVNEQVSPPETVDTGNGKGFPLEDILSRTLIDALADRDRLQAQMLERAGEYDDE